MKSAILFILFNLLIKSPAHAVGQLDLLTESERQVFESTYQICRSGSTASALRLGFNLRNFTQSLDNGLAILAGDTIASNERLRKNGLSNNIHELKHSKGFWLAMTQCYGYQHGELNYGNLMKQLIDAGHLTTEVAAGTTATIYLLSGAKLGQYLFIQYPSISRFVMSSLVAIQISDLFNKSLKLIYPDPSPAALAEAKKLQAQAFAKPDEAILSVHSKAQSRLAELNLQLDSKKLNLSEESEVKQKIQKISQLLKDLEALKKPGPV